MIEVNSPNHFYLNVKTVAQFLLALVTNKGIQLSGSLPSEVFQCEAAALNVLFALAVTSNSNFNSQAQKF